MRICWPVWYCLSDQTRLRLWAFQYEHHGLKLTLSFEDERTLPELEPAHIIERLMKVPPTRSRGLY